MPPPQPQPPFKPRLPGVANAEVIGLEITYPHHETPETCKIKLQKNITKTLKQTCEQYPGYMLRLFVLDLFGIVWAICFFDYFSISLWGMFFRMVGVRTGEATQPKNDHDRPLTTPIK